ncbi:hypothetical protein GCM10010409_35980 [Mycolicibacterium diernhoferi]
MPATRNGSANTETGVPCRDCPQELTSNTMQAASAVLAKRRAEPFARRSARPELFSRRITRPERLMCPRLSVRPAGHAASALRIVNKPGPPGPTRPLRRRAGV